MYRINSVSHKEREKFDLQSITHLDPENRWVKLAELIPWSELARSLTPVLKDISKCIPLGTPSDIGGAGSLVNVRSF